MKAPKKDRIYGSNKNKVGSSSNAKNASEIVFAESTIASIKSLISEHNSKDPYKKINLAIAKAVVRRGMGAYSSSHRKTITSGKPNSRVAWGLARLKAFIYKIENGKSKSGNYIQDDDLIRELSNNGSIYSDGGDINDYKDGIYKLAETKSFMKAPNGKPSNLTSEQWKLVRTPQFKAWFGDWENDPANASKVIDENGEPLVVYHTSSNEINVFRVDSKINTLSGKTIRTKGAYFTANPEMYQYKGGNIIKCFLDIKNPTITTDQLFSGLINEDKYRMIIERGSDGVVLNLPFINEKNTEIVVFQPNQIKLADGSNITFDGNNPDIRFAEGGRLKNSLHILIENINEEKKYFGQYKKIFNIIEEDVTFYNPFGTDDEKMIGNDFHIWISPIPDNDKIEKIKKLKGVKVLSNYYADGGKTTSEMIAPNGKPSNLTLEQWKLVRTPQFKAWFGDWENDPANASKVIDENGEPLVAYHGTDERFNIFSYKSINTTSNFYDIIGFYFTLIKPKGKSQYGKFVIPCFLNIRKQILVANPIREKNPSWETKPLTEKQIFSLLDGFEPVYEEKSKKEIVENLLKKNELNAQLIYIYQEFFNKWELKDGIELFLKTLTTKLGFDGCYMPHSEYEVAFHPNQIKLADGSNITFDDNNPDIRFAQGGKTNKTMKKIKRGGITYGKSHAEGGIPVKNQSTGDMLEVEGGEGIVNKRSMASKGRVTLNGKTMTICEAVSQLNQLEGGVKFNCDDVSDRQFLQEMAKGGQLERGTRTELEHIQTLRDLYNHRITPKQASKRIAKDHLKEDSEYYSKLAKMEGKMPNGGKTSDNPFAQFGLIKSFKGDAFKKLDEMEQVNVNYCEINKTNCSSSKGIDRKDMPQIYEEHIDEYIDFLDENGVTHNMEWGVEVGKLKPTQANISVPRIKKILTRLLNGYYTDTYGAKLNPLSRRLLATKDGYILDGHHRWASLLFLSPKNKIDVFRINADINELIDLSKKFNLVAVSEFAYGGKVDVKVPNFTSDSPDNISATFIKRGGFPQAGLYFRPTITYDVDEATYKTTNQKGYTNEMVTLEVGTRNFSEKSAYSFYSVLSNKIEQLKNEPQYAKFQNLDFSFVSESNVELLKTAKYRYEQKVKNGIDPSKIIIILTSYSNLKGTLNVNIYTPPAIDYLTKDEEFFDFIFDAVNLLTKDPNKNTETSIKLAKEESVKRKEAQKKLEEKFSTSTDYPKEMKEFNPRHLYRFKTATELELEYSTNDWKSISASLDCDWLKKATNRKILGLKIPKESQYIMKFMFSTAYLFSFQGSHAIVYHVDSFDEIFDIDLEAFKIKTTELDRVTRNLFTIDTENYYDENDVESDIGAKILNADELQSFNLNKLDFYKEAIKLAEPQNLPLNLRDGFKRDYKEWYDSKLELICENDSNSFIPSEIWQFFKYIEEQNMVFGEDYSDTIFKDVEKIKIENGVYVGVGYDEVVVIKDDLDKRVVDFTRYLNFCNRRITNYVMSEFKRGNYAGDILQQLFIPFKTWYLSSLGLVGSDTRNDVSGVNLFEQYRSANKFFSLKLNDVYIKANYLTLYSVNTSSEFFQEVDFNNEKVDLEIKYLSKQQIGNTDIAETEYIDKVFCDKSLQYKSSKTLTDTGLPSNMKNVLGIEIQDELAILFKSVYWNFARIKSYYPTLDLRTNRFMGNLNNKFPASFDDLKEQKGAYINKISGLQVPFGYAKFLSFAKENLLMDNILNDKPLVSYFYNGDSNEFGLGLVVKNPYEQIQGMFARTINQVEIYQNSYINYQISIKIGQANQAQLVKKKNKFQEEISSLTQLLQVFGNDEPLKQKIIYSKIAKVRKEQEQFIQKRYFRGDLTKLLELYAIGQKLGGQRDLANVVKCGMVTPTGKPSELDIVQYKLVRTPEFKKWFGDWEEAYVTKDYSSVSKAINPETAEPIVCYHGKGNMKAEATYFNLANFPVKYVATNLSYSVWFAQSRNPISVIYEFYTKLINPIDLSKAKLGDITPNDFKALVSSIYGYDIKTRLIAEDRPQRLWQILRANPLMLKEVRDNTNYDGFIIYEDNPSDILPSGEPNSTLDYIVFDNKQLKSADNRNNTFLIDSPDFRFDDGGIIKSDL